ncbi:MAG: hypothetical protein COA84_15410 [Robiginitomaculum sp.]|nr:MAG: hypothetical protein COA84_15410 [Robiginitomaculum sp.]
MTETSKQESKFYSGYDNWKGWDKFFSYTEENAQYFLGECRDLKVQGGTVLEIGFGSGGFMAWARDNGASIVGTEIQPRLLKAAKKADIKTLPAKFEDVAKENATRFDLIVAFDVFEHFTLDEIITRLRATEAMLRPGGHLLLRFPNGQSPFGLAPQNGDPTHKTALSRSIFEQLIQTMDFEIIRYNCAFRMLGNGLPRKLVRIIRYSIQKAITGLLNIIYTQDIPWEPVVVLVLRKRV